LRSLRACLANGFVTDNSVEQSSHRPKRLSVIEDVEKRKARASSPSAERNSRRAETEEIVAALTRIEAELAELKQRVA
jgi:hypothetical protein